MTIKNKSLPVIETGLITIIWIIVYLSPLIFQSSTQDFNMQQVIQTWKKLFPFVILSFFNHFILVPYFLFKKRNVAYLIATILTLVVFAFILWQLVKPLPPPRNPMGTPPPPGGATYDAPRPAIQRRNQNLFPPYIASSLIAIMILGFDTGIRTVFKLSKIDREKNLLEKEKVESQIAFLRNQVSPHFFMNTLNNIHALIDIDGEVAKETVVGLSSLMRYLLYETNKENVPLKNEIDFLKSYIDLMKIRLTEKTHVNLTADIEDEAQLVPPLLFTSLIENAFKYGVSSISESWIIIHMKQKGRLLKLQIENTKNPIKKSENGDEGIGLANTRNRLDLLFDKNYQLDIEESNTMYIVNLKITL